jgi:hypothetical protein
MGMGCLSSRQELYRMSENVGILMVISILLIAFKGEPDLVDSIIYYLTGDHDVWKAASG